MAEPKHKLREVKKKTIVDRLKSSALFILLMIIVSGTGIVTFIIWLSELLSGKLQGDAIWKSTMFFAWIIIFAAVTAFLAFAYFYQKVAKSRKAAV